MSEGVGRSQVVPYVVRLAERGVEVTLHSFEKGTPDQALAERLAAAGVGWRPHPFCVDGAVGGLVRVAHGAGLVATAAQVHARSDLAAAACLVTRKRRWIWDMRALWREERLALGLLEAGSPQERVMKGVEGAAARHSSGIITLSQAAVDLLGRRYGADVASKSRVITTCVDLERFAPSALPDPDPVRILLAGTLSPLYDVPSMLRLFECIRSRRPADLTVLTPDAAHWQAKFDAAGAVVRQAAASAMPDEVRQHHIGLSMRTLDISNCAATPTKLGEFLACGRPVVVSPGLGDMDSLLARHDCGVVVGDLSDEGLARAAAELDRLLADPSTPDRCRALAEEYFDLDRGVDQLLDAYRATAG